MFGARVLVTGGERLSGEGRVWAERDHAGGSNALWGTATMRWRGEPFSGALSVSSVVSVSAAGSGSFGAGRRIVIVETPVNRSSSWLAISHLSLSGPRSSSSTTAPGAPAHRSLSMHVKV